MGKSTSKIIEELYIRGWPKRYMVTNTEQIILVTYDYRYAHRVADAIKSLENPSSYKVKIK
jgi:hypothetical protein